MSNPRFQRRRRSEMEEIIRSGGSIMHEGQVITRVEDLPTDADLAEGDPELEASTLEDIDSQIAKLNAQRDRLKTPVADRPPKPTSAASPQAGKVTPLA
ncbi:hypothetical protein ACYOEI_23580, partial [Singulisphaera rosea]